MMLAYRKVARKQAGLNLVAGSLRIIVGGIFCFSGLLKITNHEIFLKALVAYDFLPKLIIDVVALGLPQAEVGLGIMFIFGIKLRPVSLTLVALLIIFSAAGAIAHLRGGAADCGCFPVAGGESTFGEAFLIRNGLLILACLWVAFRFKGTPYKNHQPVQLQGS
jgi:uncharacterized membrane protein YphA (DoxX/SURF4 family)